MDHIKKLLRDSKPSKATSERASIVEFFVENVKDKKGKKYRVSFIGMKLSHLKLSDLYYMMSEAKSYEKKGGEISKYFFGSLKLKK